MIEILVLICMHLRMRTQGPVNAMSDFMMEITGYFHSTARADFKIEQLVMIAYSPAVIHVWTKMP